MGSPISTVYFWPFLGLYHKNTVVMCCVSLRATYHASISYLVLHILDSRPCSGALPPSVFHFISRLYSFKIQIHFPEFVSVTADKTQQCSSKQTAELPQALKNPITCFTI